MSAFSGPEAFKEVAKPDGAWNWALSGADPQRLPICGGGRGGVDEMREAVGKHANTFGLLRMVFVDEAKRKRVKHVYIHASNMDDIAGENKFTQRERALAMSKGPLMEAALEKFAKLAAKIEITDNQDCTVDFICKKLARVSVAHAEDLTDENYYRGHQEFLEEHPLPEEEAVREEAAGHVERRLSVLSPASKEPEPDAVEMDSDEMAARVRAPVRLYKRGDVVKVYSSALGAWLDDGTIMEILPEAATRDGFPLPAGSMKVSYKGGARFKWVTPAQASAVLKDSDRPAPPPPLAGEMFKEYQNFSTEWHARHVEVSAGVLRWWPQQEDAEAGQEPNEAVPLFGLQCKVASRSQFSLSTASSKGVRYSFDARTEASRKPWLDSLQQHAEFCDQMGAYLLKNPQEVVAAAPSLGGLRSCPSLLIGGYPS